MACTWARLWLCARVVASAGGQVGVEGAGEVFWLDDDAGFGVELEVNLDLVAGRYAGGPSVGVAEAEQEAAAHDRDPAAPGVPVDRDDHRRPFASIERLYHFWRDFQASHWLGRLDFATELHGGSSSFACSSSASCCTRKRR